MSHFANNKLSEKPQSHLDQLKIIPIRNEHVKRERVGNDGMKVTIEFQTKNMFGILRKATGGKKSKTYTIDGYGLYLYEQINGKSSLLEMTYNFMERDALTFFEAKGLIQEYVRILMEKGVVVLAK
jgi:hypothetical protein